MGHLGHGSRLPNVGLGRVLLHQPCTPVLMWKVRQVCIKQRRPSLLQHPYCLPTPSLTRTHAWWFGHTSRVAHCGSIMPVASLSCSASVCSRVFLKNT